MRHPSPTPMVIRPIHPNQLPGRPSLPSLLPSQLPGRPNLPPSRRPSRGRILDRRSRGQ